MKIQNIAIVFAIIVIPISLLLTAYTQNRIDTISLQSAYDSKLLDSAYDAVLAFQMNSINNSYTTNTDSTRRDVQASMKTFTNTLATNLGVEGYSNQYLLPYIPAMVFTLNDGYYIYSPINNNGTIEHVIKPYVYYTARYKKEIENTDVVINYSLDNYITVYGKVKGTYIKKAGYLINRQEWNEGDSTYYGVKIEKESLKETVYFEETGTTEEECNFIYVTGNTGTGTTKLYQGRDGTYFKLENGKKKQASAPAGGIMKDSSAINYYKKAAEFTKWVEDNLGNLTPGDIVDNDEYYQNPENKNKEFSYAKTQIFKFSATNDPDDINSPISQHKRDIMKLSLEKNIRYAIDEYASRPESTTKTVYNFAMPILTEEDWDKILSNVSFICFLQGLPVGSKVYNNYVIVNSTQNTQYVDPNNIYYVLRDEYHKIGCTDLINEAKNNSALPVTGYNNIDYRMRTRIYTHEDPSTGKEIKEYKYYYKRGEEQDYNCMVSSYAKPFNIFSIVEERFFRGDPYSKTNEDANGNKIIETLPMPLRKAYYRAIAREKYNMYRLNDFFVDP